MHTVARVHARTHTVVLNFGCVKQWPDDLVQSTVFWKLKSFVYLCM